MHKWVLKEHKSCFEINYTFPIVLKNGRLRSASPCLLCVIFDCVSDVLDSEVAPAKKKGSEQIANTSSGMFVVSLPQHKGALMISRVPLTPFD